MNPQLLSYAGLVQQYYNLLFRRARMITLDTKIAETLAEQSLIQLWACRKQILDPQQVREFLRNNIRVLCHSWLQQQALLVDNTIKEKE